LLAGIGEGEEHGRRAFVQDCDTCRIVGEGGVDTCGSGRECVQASGRGGRAGGDVEEWRPAGPQAWPARIH
jgi:hypothetical protein